jgi:DNA polymerase III subunit epsilon
MREIVLDTETTGLSPRDGHRIVEIGAVELINHMPSGESFHVYLNPMRDMPREAEAIHGLSSEFLKDKPTFDAIADSFLAFIGKDPMIIHNASFDMTFINWELMAIGRQAIDPAQVVDSLAIAKQKYPMASNSLDALCRRFGIDLSKRTKHGALLDSELLADVYLELIGGRQTALGLAAPTAKKQFIQSANREPARARPIPLASRLSSEELAAHANLVAEIGAQSKWN